MNEIIGMTLSLIGMVFNISSFQFRKKITVLIVQTIGASVFMVSYFFSGGGIGMVLNGICIFRNLLLMKIGDKKGKPLLLCSGGLCVAYVIGVCVYTLAFIPDASTADKLWNLLPLIGCFIGTVALSFTNLNLFRAVRIGESCCWLAYNVNIGLGALGGIFTEIFSLCSIVIGLIRFRGKGTKENIRPVEETE